MEKVVLVFGGSVLAPPEPDPAFLRAVAEALQEWSQQRQLYVVVGGGRTARRPIEVARHLGVGEEHLDRIGIHATRVNAQLLASTLASFGADVNGDIPTTVEQALALGTQHGIVVMGGTSPGHSTDFVGVVLAIAAKAARFINATNVDGVYTRDPNKHRDAKRLDSLTFEEMLQIIEEREWTAAGAPGVIDGPSTLKIATAGLPTDVVLGRDLANLAKAVAGEPFKGTSIRGAKVVL